MATKNASKKNNDERTDAVTLLENDHDEVRELLKELDATTDRAAKRRRELVEEIGVALRAHARIEEEIFYPAFRDAARTKEERKIFFEATEEHGLVDIVLPELENTEPDTDQFAAKAKVLKDLVEHHADEEEDEMLPLSKKLLGRERLLELGEEMKARKEELLSELASEPRARAPREAGESRKPKRAARSAGA